MYIQTTPNIFGVNFYPTVMFTTGSSPAAAEIARLARTFIHWPIKRHQVIQTFTHSGEPQM